jgi:hypothetical protein
MTLPDSAFSHINSIIQSDSNLKEKLSGRSLTFGIINRRNQTCEYSRNNWLRGELYSALLQFAKQYVTVPFDCIALNFGNNTQTHRIKNSRGVSFTVATGNYTEGELTVCSGEKTGSHCIFHTPFLCDLSKQGFKLEDFTGERVVLIFYKFYSKRQTVLPLGELREEKGEFVFYRGEKKMKQNGKKGRPVIYAPKLTRTLGPIEVTWE